MDLNSLNQSVLRLIENGTRIISFLKDFTTGTAGDVSITYINADGSESVKTFSNIAKFTSSVSGAVKGELHKELYLDQLATVNGDGTQSSPYNSFISAVNSVGRGGSRTIILLNDCTLKSSDNKADIAKKKINIVGGNHTLKLIIDSDKTPLPLAGGVFCTISDTNIEITNTFDTVNRGGFTVSENSFLAIYNKKNISIGDYSQLIWVREGEVVIGGGEFTFGANDSRIGAVRTCSLQVEPNKANFTFSGSEPIDWSALQNEFKNRTVGVIKDVNGSVVNVNSNITF